MAADERNFRSSYYEKVGFRSVEEKKSLEILLKDKPLDKTKLRQFCLRFTVPGIYRNFVWRVLLDVVPIHTDSHEFVMQQREEEYKDLCNALKLLRYIDDGTPKPHLYLLMWVLQSGKMEIDPFTLLDNPVYRSLSRISDTLCMVFENDVDIYWISKGFFEFVVNFYNDVSLMKKYTKSVLEKEDQELCGHLQSIGALDTLPFHDWFCSCFANIIIDTSVVKIWDKVAGGSSKILIFVAVVVLITLRRTLLKCSTIESVTMCLSNISEEASEAIVNQAVDMWQQHGSSLSVVSCTDTTKALPLPVRLSFPK